MSLITMVLVLLFVGFIVWIIKSAPIPVDPWIRMVIGGLIIFAVLVWVLNQFGIHTGIPIHL